MSTNQSSGVYFNSDSTSTYTGSYSATAESITISQVENLAYALDDINQNIVNIKDTYINKDGSVGFTGDVDVGNHRITNVVPPVDDNDAATKVFVENEIASIGDVFVYEGEVAANPVMEDATDLGSLSNTSVGAYYTASSSGYLMFISQVKFVNEGDGVLFTGVDDFSIIDNTNTELEGVIPYIAIQGNPDSGYVIDIHQSFKNRVSTIEGSFITAVQGNSPIYIAGSDPQRPIVRIRNVTQTENGAMSYTDKIKVDSVEDGAQVNTVNSVNGYTGIVNLSKTDIGLSNVDNYFTASVSQSTTGTANDRFSTPAGIRGFVENGDYVIDCGTF